MKVVPSILLLVLSVCITETRGMSPTFKADSTSYEQQLEAGVEAFYRTDWEQARQIFKELKSQNPDDSRAYFFDAMLPFWKYYFGGEEKATARLFLTRSQKAIDISRNQLNENPRDTTLVLMLSGLHGYRSLVAAAEKQYQTAVKSGMTGFKYTRQLLSLNNEDPNALIGKGMFYYMVGSVPAGLKWVTNIAGFSGDQEEGFEALKLAAESESYVSNDAKMILAYLYERENKPHKAVGYMEDLIDRYPENIIFRYNLARLYDQGRQPAEARKHYELVTASNNGEFNSLKQKSRMQLKEL